MKLLHGDCREIMKQLPDASVDSIVTDPPYELGFMGKSWDSTGVAYDVTVWRECLRVLKPGGHLLAFGGSRTYHRLAVAIEDAGFDIRDQIMWVYGSGFPKSLNVGKAITAYEKTGSSQPKNLRQVRMGDNYKPTGQEDYRKGRMFSTDIENDNSDTELTESAQQWDGWGTALKPAHEPIVMARKPLDGTVANNVLTHGVGAINIDGTRVGEGAKKWVTPRGGIWSTDSTAKAELIDNPLGRFPANFIHDGSDEVIELLENAARFFYCPKANKAERNAGLEALPPQQPVGGTDKWTEQDRRKGEGITRQPSQNFHPTVKPLALMQYLVRLVTPPNGIVLDPFAGSGTTLVAATMEKFDCIGIEMTDEYLPIIEARVAHAKTDTLF